MRRPQRKYQSRSFLESPYKVISTLGLYCITNLFKHLKSSKYLNWFYFLLNWTKNLINENHLLLMPFLAKNVLKMLRN